MESSPYTISKIKGGESNADIGIANYPALQGAERPQRQNTLRQCRIIRLNEAAEIGAAVMGKICLEYWQVNWKWSGFRI